jgi:carbon storage regulator
MLVLSRKIGEQLQIGDSIVVKVLKIRGSRIRLGIEAPDRCRIMRGELDLADDGLTSTSESCTQG